MPRQITLADGREIEVECISCALTSGILPSIGGVIYETDRFHVHQDVAYPIRGLAIVAAKRHFYGLDEMTSEEQREYIAILHKVRTEQRRRLGVEHVYYFYNEDTTHHFHTWMVPRYEWMKSFGHSVESLRPALLHARHHMNGDDQMASVLSGIEALRAGMQGFRVN